MGFWLTAGQMEKPGRMREEWVSKGGYQLAWDVLVMAIYWASKQRHSPGSGVWEIQAEVKARGTHLDIGTET